LLRHRHRLKGRLDVWVVPRGQGATHSRGRLLILG
jgi:hypothetical protein